MSRTFFFSLIVLAALAAPAAAQSGDPDRSSAAGALKACTWIVDEAERLACFDRAARALETAPETRRPEAAKRPPAARETAPSAGPTDDFGLPPQQRRDAGEGSDRREMVIAQARQAPFGEWIFIMENGQTWVQTDGGTLPSSPVGQEVRVTKGVLGSHFMTVDGRTIRVKRHK